MKTRKNKTRSKSILMGLLAVITAFAFTSCSKQITFVSSKVVPAAEGTVKVKQDKNKNFLISIKIKNLANVARLQPPKKTYVVWMLSDHDQTINIGVMTSSSKLSAAFEAVSASKPIKIFITAEDDAAALQPDDRIVLTTEKFKTKG